VNGLLHGDQIVTEFAGKIAFITGGSSGIGLGISRACAAGGLKVALGYRQERHLAQALAALAGFPDVFPVRLEVTDRDSFHQAADAAETHFGKIHVLVNAAGASLFGPMDIATFDDWDWVLGVNFGGAINSLVTVLPRVKAHGEGGHVVNVASMASFLPGAEAGLYTASKFAVRGLTECLRLTLAPQGIGVSLAAPALTATNMHEALLTRPARFGDTAFPCDPAMAERLRAIHALGSDPFAVGERIFRGMLDNEPVIFTHGGFADELRGDFGEILAAVPNGPPDPRHAAIEQARRERKAEASRQARSIRTMISPIPKTAMKV
jgi:NAD(P)-dependent dehydrogenase (short-subunit alcohol dehydrogenase family)